MAIAIILRKRYNINKFRDLMIDVIQSGYGDSALLCSGFFQEGFHGNGYRVSQEKQLAQVLSQSQIELTTVGIHNNTWKSSYQYFRDSLITAGVNIKAKYKSGLKWHAKVFILSRGRASIFGIIGSSNMTRNAFGAGKYFNYECDVVLWSDTVPKLNRRVNEFLSRDFEDDELIRAPYLPEENRGISVQARLDRLKAEILEPDLDDLD